MALATTFDLPNFVGELFGLTPTETPFLSMIGGLTGGREANAKNFQWQTYDLAAASQPQIVEGAAPTSAHRSRAEVNNVVQIFQYGVEISYTKLAAVGQLDSTVPILGNQPVQNELDWQLMLKLEQAALDVNFTFHQGAYTSPADNTTGRRSRGMATAITTNTTAAGTTALDDAKVDATLKQMWDSGAPFRMPVIFVNAFQKQQLSGIYGYAPEDRNIGGVNINVIETDFARIGVVLDRQVLASTFYVYDVSVCAPRFLRIPNKGHFFVEELGKTAAKEEAQLYGEVGLEYGPEKWHGEITGLTTS